MSAPAAVGVIACAVFGAAMLHAIVTDMRHRRIRNWLVAGLAVAWTPMALAAGIPAAEMATAVAAAVLVFVAGVACFAAGWLGGGDVKLAAVAVLWLGAGQALAFVLLTSVLGAVLTGLFLLARRRRGPRDRPPAGAAPADAPRADAPRADAPRPVPYGPALAVAGIALLHGSPWAAVL